MEVLKYNKQMKLQYFWPHHDIVESTELFSRNHFPNANYVLANTENKINQTHDLFSSPCL